MSTRPPIVQQHFQVIQLPLIETVGRQLREVTRDAVDALAFANSPPCFFCRGGQLVHLGADPVSANIMLTALTGSRLRHHLARTANWFRDCEPAAPPMAVVMDIEATPALSDFPILDAVVTCPVLSPAGQLITEAGYHPSCRLWHQPAPDLTLGPLPRFLSPTAIRHARRFIEENLLVDFPFVAECDRAVAWACMILPFVRPAIDGPTPLHLIEAPTRGTGKTLLAQCLMIPALGHAPLKPMTIDCEEPEMRKRITAKLLEAPMAVFFDNLGQGRQLGSSSLAAVLTSQAWEDRILGQSRIVSVPVECVWLLTANNPRLSDEMIRRTVNCRLDSCSARPHMRREFRHPQLVVWARANRSLLVQAILTLIRAWQIEGQPPGDAHLGMYESWSQVVDGVLRVAGIDGLQSAIERLQGASTDTETTLGPFLMAWSRRHGSSIVGVKELYAVACEAQCLEAVLDVHLSERERRRSRAGESERSLQTRLGKALRRLSGQVYLGQRIEEMGLDRCGRQTYRLVPA